MGVSISGVIITGPASIARTAVWQATLEFWKAPGKTPVRHDRPPWCRARSRDLRLESLLATINN
jgi:hypothetical protein